MTTLFLALFWVSVAVIVYTYAAFPVILVVRGWLWPKPHEEASITPSVTLIVAAYNEANIIEAKLKNTLALDYPRDRLQVIVASDGSADGTNEIVRRYAAQGISLLDLPRGGKNAALNAAVEHASGEILVFSDAPSMYAPDAIRELTRHFADAAVGGVAGSQVYLEGEGSASLSGSAEDLYWGLDQKLKELQSRGGNVTSATGAIYAIRRELFRRILPHVVDDSYVSIGIVAQGKRLVYAPKARAFEPLAESGDKEFGRKLRVSMMGMYSVLETPGLFNPFVHGFYSLQIFTHKILRRMLFVPLIMLFVASIFLWPLGMLYQLAAIAQALFYLLALAGMFAERAHISQRLTTRWPRKVLAAPYYFCMVYVATMITVIRILRGKRMDRWETSNRTDVELSP